MLNGFDITTAPSCCLMRTTPVAAANMAWTMRRTFELTPVSANALSRNSWLSGGDSLSSFPEEHVDEPYEGTYVVPASPSRPESSLGVRYSLVQHGHQSTRHDGREQLVRVAEEADRTIVCHVVTGALLVHHDELPPHHFWRDTLRVPHHATYAEEFIPSVHGPSVGFNGHVVTYRCFAIA